MDTRELWNNVLNEIELTVSKATFNTWFRDTFILKNDTGVISLAVPNSFVEEWLKSKHHSLILKLLRTGNENIHALEYVIAKDDRLRRKEREERVSRDSLPLGEPINRDDNLNPRYTFDTFVVGPFNELAHAAAQAVLKQPGLIYNPLFIYGNTGHGKTHLIQAVGNSIKAMDRSKRVLYITSERFASEIISSIQTGKIAQVKDKYRGYDVLVMDDIQFVANKDRTQEELFHLFNSLYDNNKQIIFSSDKHPNLIPNLEDRLKSRFSQGMTVDIQPPDFESRLSILSKKAESMGFCLTGETATFLANTITGNIRELEGILNSIVMQTQLKAKELTINDVRNLVKSNLKPKRLISPKEVVKMIADFYHVEEDSIYEKTRRKEVIKPRQVAMFILREDFNISYPSIGEKIGGRDHTTVIHSCEKIKEEVKSDNGLMEEINQLRAMIA
ncbi:MAG: chromosomal replication initiator protein DnaA [Minisyncoccia bacterium]